MSLLFKNGSKLKSEKKKHGHLNMMTAENHLIPGQLATGVDLSLVCPGTNFQRLIQMYFSNSDPEIRQALEARIEEVLAAEQEQLDGFARLVMNSFNPDLAGDVVYTGYFAVESAYDKDGTIRENSNKLVMNDPYLPFESIITDRKDVAGLIEKMTRKRSVRDGLRVRILVEGDNKREIYVVKDHLDGLGPLAIKLGMNYFAPSETEIKDYTKNPKEGGYGEFGVMHYPILFSVPGEEPLRAIEVQIMTQEQAFQEARDSYHRERKQELLFDLAA